MEVDWGKIHKNNNHSKLFLPSDKKKIPYYYIDTNTAKLMSEMKYGYARSLASIKNRLDLLGYSMKNIEEKYNHYLNELELMSINAKIPFKFFKNAIYNIDISMVNTIQRDAENFDNGYDIGEYARYCLMEESEIKKIMEAIPAEIKKDCDLETYFENIDPYIIIRILAENDANKNLELQWRYDNIINDEWMLEDKLYEELSREDKILIVTEGSSDSFVLDRSIKELYSDVADFFEFVDMEENYPFTGAGNLYNFFLGLVKINVQNKIIVIFDNDVAGNEKYNLSNVIKIPNNIMIYKLPYCTEFECISTIGPTGESNENINGKAVAIECFLDFNSISSNPLIRWTSFSEKLKMHQGELVKKDYYVREFKKANLSNSDYCIKKIKLLIDCIIESWINR